MENIVGTIPHVYPILFWFVHHFFKAVGEKYWNQKYKTRIVWAATVMQDDFLKKLTVIIKTTRVIAWVSIPVWLIDWIC